jgi:diguanylate cyclase (GGDEF)-like protein/PAS domain S-box-containing protein
MGAPIPAASVSAPSFYPIPIPVLAVSREGIVVAANLAAQELFRSTTEVLLGLNLDSLLPQAATRIRDSSLKSEAVLNFNDTAYAADGMQRSLTVYAIPATELDSVWLLSLHDISPWVEEIQDLRNRLRLETLLTSLSTHFINLEAARMDDGMQYGLKMISQFVSADRVSLCLSSQGPGFTLEQEWCATDLPSRTHDKVAARGMYFPFLREEEESLRTVIYPRVSQMPSGNARDSLTDQGVKSFLAVPLMRQGSMKGFLVFEALIRETRWPEPYVAMLRMAGELFINALERRRSDLELEKANAKYLQIFEHAVEGIFQTTPDGRCLSANPTLARIFGFNNPEEMISDLGDIAYDIYLDPDRRRKFVQSVTRDGSITEFESRARRCDGSLIWISENARVVKDDSGKVLYFEGTVIDISGRKRLEARMIHDALHDALTGLANRTLFLDRLERTLERIHRRPDERCAVLLLDLDRFKVVNDSMGHTLGDRLLVAVARRLESLLPEGTTLSRLGGDEFGILLEDVTDVAPAEDLARKLLSEMEKPLRLDHHDIYTNGSIGISLGSPQNRAAGEILRDADTALHRAKSAGKGCHAVFDTSMHDNAVELLRLETDMRKALERGEFLLHYQPIVALSDFSLSGFEALVRWNHPTRGLVPPGDFIPLAEDTGLIVPLGKWVVEEAARQLSEWQQIMLGPNPLTMSVNISGKQFEAGDLAQEIQSAGSRVGILPNTLKLEITESSLMANPDGASELLGELKDSGFPLSLDDFGTGYSSLSYLHRYPFHTLKIDRSFISRLDQGNKQDEIVRSIHSMAQNLGMDVVAEGIETEAQLEHLQRHGVQFGQGYLFSRPLPAKDAKRWVIETGIYPPKPPT